MPRIAGLGLLAAAHVRVKAWDRALANVENAQTAQLLELVGHAKNTEFGRAHGFSEIRTYDDYRRRVPVADYDAFAVHFERMRRGERNIVVPEFVEHFGNSSGSTSTHRVKYLPITERQMRFQSGNGGDALSRYLVKRDVRDFTDGFVMNLVPPLTMKQEGPIKVTRNPSLVASRLPPLARPIYLPDRPTMCIPDYEARLDRIADRYLDYDIRMVSGTTCWFSILFDKLLEVAHRRGREVSTVGELWPNLRVTFGGGVAAAPYLPVIRERMGHEIELVDTYNATEGGVFASTPFESGLTGMMMIPHRGVFFEFIPIEEHGHASASRVPLWEVETGRNYVILVTNASGMYSYELGDLVRFTSTDPHMIEFAGRLSGCLSTTQELTTHAEIQSAMDAALVAAPSTVIDYGVGADIGIDGSSKSRYVLFAEFDGGRMPDDTGSFMAAFDDALRHENHGYARHRANDTAILAPELVVLAPGTVKRFLQEVGSGGVQTKFPRILDDHRKQILRDYARRSS